MLDSTIRNRVFRSFSLLTSSLLIALNAPAFVKAQSADSERTLESGKKRQRPNILFIFSDDHAPHAIGAYGSPFAKLNPTPNIDQLARQGMLFQNSFCTNSICGPSRAVILTGKHSHLNGFMMNGNRFDGDQQTFPKLMRKAGYKTALIGKWHLTSDPQGFDYWDVLPGQGMYYNPTLIRDGKRRQVEGHCTDIVTDLAIEWLKKQKDDQPFMLMCQHKAPHRTWMPALRHLNLYDDVEAPEPATLFDDHKDDASPARNQEMEIDRHMHPVFDLFFDAPKDFDPKKERGSDKSGFRNKKLMTEEQRKKWDEAFAKKNKAYKDADLSGKALVRAKYQRYIKNYLRCIKGVDESVGRLMEYLKTSGLDQNTIVIYSSDQGFYLGDHGWYDKRWMYEESMKMPLIVKWPGVTKPGSVNKNLVQNLDYAETFLEIAGAGIPDDMQGRSLVPLLKGEKVEDWRSSVYYHYHGFPAVHMVAKHYGIRTDRYKLIRFYQMDEWEFYDLKNDPDETNNAFQDPKYAQTISEMRKQLAELKSHYRDRTDVRPKPQAWQNKYRKN